MVVMWVLEAQGWGVGGSVCCRDDGLCAPQA